LGQKHTNDLDSLIKDLKDRDSSVRASAAKSLGNLNDSRAIDPLIQAFKDKNSSVKVNAEKSLVKLGKQSVGPLIHALCDEDSSVRDLAAKTLGDLKDIQALEPLIYTLEDDNFFVIQNDDAIALGKINDL
jgi:HEAT repeat protein